MFTDSAWEFGVWFCCHKKDLFSFVIHSKPDFWLLAYSWDHIENHLHSLEPSPDVLEESSMKTTLQDQCKRDLCTFHSHLRKLQQYMCIKYIFLCIFRIRPVIFSLCTMLSYLNILSADTVDIQMPKLLCMWISSYGPLDVMLRRKNTACTPEVKL